MDLPDKLHLPLLPRSKGQQQCFATSGEATVAQGRKGNNNVLRPQAGHRGVMGNEIFAVFVQTDNGIVYVCTALRYVNDVRTRTLLLVVSQELPSNDYL